MTIPVPVFRSIPVWECALCCYRFPDTAFSQYSRWQNALVIFHLESNQRLSSRPAIFLQHGGFYFLLVCCMLRNTGCDLGRSPHSVVMYIYCTSDYHSTFRIACSNSNISLFIACTVHSTLVHRHGWVLFSNSSFIDFGFFIMLLATGLVPSLTACLRLCNNISELSRLWLGDYLFILLFLSNMYLLIQCHFIVLINTAVFLKSVASMSLISRVVDLCACQCMMVSL